MSGAPDARQRLPALINFSGAGRPRSCSTTSLNPTTAAYRRSALGVKPPCGSSLGSYFLVLKREQPPPDNQHSGFPPLADVLDSERPIDRLPPRKSGTSARRH